MEIGWSHSVGKAWRRNDSKMLKRKKDGERGCVRRARTVRPEEAKKKKKFPV